MGGLARPRRCARGARGGRPAWGPAPAGRKGQPGVVRPSRREPKRPRCPHRAEAGDGVRRRSAALVSVPPERADGAAQPAYWGSGGCLANGPWRVSPRTLPGPGSRQAVELPMRRLAGPARAVTATGWRVRHERCRPRWRGPCGRTSRRTPLSCARAQASDVRAASAADGSKLRGGVLRRDTGHVAPRAGLQRVQAGPRAPASSVGSGGKWWLPSCRRSVRPRRAYAATLAARASLSSTSKVWRMRSRSAVGSDVSSSMRLSRRPSRRAPSDLPAR